LIVWCGQFDQICPGVDGLDAEKLGAMVMMYLSIADGILEALASATWLRCIGVWIGVSHCF
jgi:hypothetical protein